MQKLRHMIMLMVILSLIVFSTIETLAEEMRYDWSLQHIKPTGSIIDQEVEWLIEELTEKVDGRININVHPNAELGDYSVVQMRVSIGDVTMQIGPLAAIEDPREMLSTFPYLITEWEQIESAYAYRIADEENFITETISEILEQQNIKLLASWPAYWGAIGTTLKPENPDKIERHRIDIRSPEIPSFELTAQVLGYNPISMAYSDAYTAIEAGTVDGLIGAGTEAHFELFGDVLDYNILVHNHMETHWWYMNLQTWNVLSEEDQQSLLEVAEELERRRFKAIEAEEEEYQKLLLEHYGIETIDPGEEARLEFARAVREDVWPRIEHLIGRELVEQLREHFPIKGLE